MPHFNVAKKLCGTQISCIEKPQWNSSRDCTMYVSGITILISKCNQSCIIWNICVTNDHGYVPLVVNTSQSFPHS
jgi:hypothetical protein